MLITTTTTIGFKLPEENNLVEKFMSEHDMNKWSEDVNTDYIFFTAKSHSQTENIDQGDTYVKEKETDSL